jgi:hypothetical protein
MTVTNYERVQVTWRDIHPGMFIEVQGVFYTVVGRCGETFTIVAYGSEVVVTGQPPLGSDVTRMLECDATVTEAQAQELLSRELSATLVDQPADAGTPAPAQAQAASVAPAASEPVAKKLEMTHATDWCQCPRPGVFVRSDIDPDIWICSTCKCVNEGATNRVRAAHETLDKPRALAPCEQEAVDAAAASQPAKPPLESMAELETLHGIIHSLCLKLNEIINEIENAVLKMGML